MTPTRSAAPDLMSIHMDSDSEPYFISTPDRFFDRVVLPNYADFIDNQADLRLAMNAAIACLSMRDWVLGEQDLDRTELKAKTSDLQQDLVKREPMFQHLSDIAKASKHYRITEGARAGFVAAAVRVDHLRAGDPCGHPLRPIKVVLPDKSIVFFRDILVSAVVMWARHLGRDPRSIAELQSY